MFFFKQIYSTKIAEYFRNILEATIYINLRNFLANVFYECNYIRVHIKTCRDAAQTVQKYSCISFILYSRIL